MAKYKLNYTGEELNALLEKIDSMARGACFVSADTEIGHPGESEFIFSATELKDVINIDIHINDWIVDNACDVYIVKSHNEVGFNNDTETYTLSYWGNIKGDRGDDGADGEDGADSSPIQTISVNGDQIEPDENKNVEINIPDVPIQSIVVNGDEVSPEDGTITIDIPDAPIQSISVNGETVDPEDGHIALEIDVPKSYSVHTDLLPVFTEDTTYTDYPYVGTIAIEGVTENSIVEVIFGVTEATSGNYAPIATSHDGEIHIYSKTNEEITIPSVVVFN